MKKVENYSVQAEGAAVAALASLIEVCDPEVRQAIDHRVLEYEAHGVPNDPAVMVIWLLEYGARVYLATVPREK